MRRLEVSDCYVGFVVFWRWVGVLGVGLLILENVVEGFQLFFLHNQFEEGEKNALDEPRLRILSCTLPKTV